MCGRAAQSQRAVRAAEAWVLRRPQDANEAKVSSDHTSTATSPQHQQRREGTFPSCAAVSASSAIAFQDNYNMSPGMKAVVFSMDHSVPQNNSPSRPSSLRVTHKVWGLVPKPGTAQNPIPMNDMSQHFSNLMFNARSDTLCDKRTFRGLLVQQRTCLLPVDGFFEWKGPLLKGTRKQPYFVFSRQQHDETTIDDDDHEAGSVGSSTVRPFLLMAGLWTSVSTGRKGDNDDDNETTLDTFTILTTEACPSLTWLHSRMPVCLWNQNLAHAWLRNPTRTVLQQIVKDAATQELFQWHAVTTQMSSMSYRSADAIAPVLINSTPSVKSFFASTHGSTVGSGSGGGRSIGTVKLSSKRKAVGETPEKAMPKRNRGTPSPKPMGGIAAFFSPKPKP